MNEFHHEIWKWSVVTVGNERCNTSNMGFILNQSVANIDHKQISQIYGLSHTLPRVSIYCGGPVHTDRCTVLHSLEYSTASTKPFNDNCAITFDNQIVQDIVTGRGPRHWKIMLGHCEWQDGQLDAEIMRSGGWQEVPWNHTAWGGYKRKDKMWRRMIEQEVNKNAKNFLSTVFDQ